MCESVNVVRCGERNLKHSHKGGNPAKSHEFLCRYFVQMDGMGMTDDQALKEYQTALGFLLIYWNAPETNQDPHRWGRVLEREAKAWLELNSRKLIDTLPYFDAVTNAHRSANVLRMQRYQV